MTFKKFLFRALILSCSAATFSAAAMKRSDSFDSLCSDDEPHASTSGYHAASHGTRADTPLSEELLRALQNDSPSSFVSDEGGYEDAFSRPTSPAVLSDAQAAPIVPQDAPPASVTSSTSITNIQPQPISAVASCALRSTPPPPSGLEHLRYMIDPEMLEMLGIDGGFLRSPSPF